MPARVIPRAVRRRVAGPYYRTRGRVLGAWRNLVLAALPLGVAERVLRVPLLLRLRDWGMPERTTRTQLLHHVKGWVQMHATRRAWARGVLAVADEVRPDLVFCASTTYPDLVMERCALRGVHDGPAVLVVLRTEPMAAAVCREHFDRIIDVGDNLYLLGRVLARLAPRLAVVRFSGRMMREALAVFLATVRAPYIYRASGFINQAAHAGERRTAAIALERAALQGAVLAVHNYTDAAIDFLRAHLGLDVIRHLPVVPGVHHSLAAVRPVHASAEPSVVYCGGYVAPGDRETGLHADFLQHWRWLADGGVHVHVYYSHTPRRHPRLRPVLDALDGHPYFHLYDPVPFGDLWERIQACDFMWAYFAAPFERVLPPFRRFTGANNVIGLGAGLPLITSPYYEPLHSFVKANGNGLALAAGLGPELPSIIRSADRKTLRATALSLRERFLFPDAELAAALRGATVDRAPRVADAVAVGAGRMAP